MKAAAVVAMVLGLAACTPAEVEAFLAIQAQQPTTCHEAVDRYFPANARSWMHRVVHRESRGDPRAQNRRSSAAGCAQLLRIHAWRFDATGSSWAARYDPAANIRAALHLYNDAGRRPWR